MHTIHSRRVGMAALGAVLTLGLAGCGGGGTDSPSEDSTASGFEPPAIAGGDDFCDAAASSLASAEGVTEASDDLSAAMTSGDIDALHAAGQAVLDNSAEASAFYALGAEEADDPAVKAAFTGLSEFVANYSVPLGEAGVASETSAEFLTAITVLFANPELQPLLEGAPGWATNAHDFTVERCGLEGA
jgi:hypothetical protein